MPHLLDLDLFAGHLRAAQRIYWPGCAGHSPLFERWARQAAEAAAGRWFCGMWLPGVNRFDPTALHPSVRASSFFIGPELASARERGALEHLPFSYSQAAAWLSAPGRFDLAVLHVAPPDEQGQCSLSIACDFAPAVLQALPAAGRVLAHVNPLLPRTRGPAVPVSRIDAWVEAALPPLTFDAEAADPQLAAVARQVAAHVADGDTLQFGLGKLQSAMLEQLASHRRLKLHAGMVSEGLLDLVERGCLAPSDAAEPPVLTGVALGSQRLYARVADAGLVRFAAVDHTHGHASLARIPRLKAINSALEVDLLGQVNGESLAGRQISAVGGLPDFVRGARASAGGKAIIAATARAGRGGTLSRIVPLLAPGTVSVARADADCVVTEYGSADLRESGTDARAQALIAIAAPEHRDALLEAWHTLKRQF